eukprot:50635_1
MELAYKLVYKLLKQNSQYYPLYKQRGGFYLLCNTIYTIFRICDKDCDILHLRQLLAPFMYANIIPKVNIEINAPVSSVVLSLLKIFNSIQLNDHTWLWLNREVHVMISHQTKYSKECLSSITFNVLSQLQLAHSQRSAQIAIEILHMITKMNDLDIKYEITNLDTFLEVVSIALRSTESGIVGWIILNMEINKLLIGKHYKYYNDWILYIESKCGLFKSNFIHNIK